jgi:monoamine oxidase
MPTATRFRAMLGSLLRPGRQTLAILNLALALVTVYVPWPLIRQAYSTSHDKKCPDVIIVGAGIAGLEAATELQHSGHSVMILERNRQVGGRGSVGGIGDKNTPIDYGGAWIHGAKDNPLTHLAKDMGFKLEQTEFDLPYFVNGHKATKKEMPRFDDALEKYRQRVDEAAKSVKREHDLAESACNEYKKGISQKRIYEELKGKILASKPPHLEDLIAWQASSAEEFCARADEDLRLTSDVAEKYAPQADGIGDDIIALLIANSGPLESAVELNKTSAVDAAEFQAGDEWGGDFLVNKGMGAFVQELGKKLVEKGLVHLNSLVTKVDYSGQGVKVTAGGTVFEGSYALVTVSVGVLKGKGITFKPELPREKCDAIERLQMGNMQKVIVPLKEDIFNDNLPDVKANSWILYEGDLPHDALSFASEHHLPLIRKKRAVMAFLINPLNQNIAVGFFGGDWAKALEGECSTAYVEQFSGESKPCDHLSVEITESALSNISRRTVTEVESNIQGRIQVTHWSLDPTSFGAYSAAEPGEWYEREILAKPVMDDTGASRLFFAGEGTAEPKYNGSYAGAFESGRRAAERIDYAMRHDGSPHRLASIISRGCGPVGRVFWIFVGIAAAWVVGITISLMVAGSWSASSVALRMLRMANVIAIIGATLSSLVLPGNKLESAATVILIGIAGYFLGRSAKTLPTG